MADGDGDWDGTYSAGTTVTPLMAPGHNFTISFDCQQIPRRDGGVCNERRFLSEGCSGQVIPRTVRSRSIIVETGRASWVDGAVVDEKSGGIAETSGYFPVSVPEITGGAKP